MKRPKNAKTTTITIRLTDDQHDVLQRLCRLKHTSQTAYMSYLAAEQALKELLNYAVREYLEGKASLSALSNQTGLDVPTLMNAVADVSAEDKRVVESFRSAAKALSVAHKDPKFYELALKALAS
ncbi:MAG: hypothetical protein HYR55_20245 [Acidobacteria bacterium]|nr:hypothetical protein [Acidobacteriota bacterium]MBI3657676.1 hypothetical protein [Acidobacteriota bacterium]